MVNGNNRTVVLFFLQKAEPAQEDRADERSRARAELDRGGAEPEPEEA
jgi:hypothetical protein